MAANGRTIGFDFAIVEECQVYAECSEFTDAYGTQVYEIEYNDNGGTSNFTKACNARGATTSVIYRDRDVVPQGTSGYVYKYC
jgi:methylaspartate ammonia-lyase